MSWNTWLKRGGFALCPSPKTEHMGSFQTAITKGDKRSAEASGNAASVPKASVVEGCSKTQTSLKSIIGTAEIDCSAARRARVGAIPYSAPSRCAPPPTPPKNSISESYELLILLQQPACLALIPDFVETHNFTDRDSTAKPTPQKNPGFVSCPYFLTNPPTPPPPRSPLGRRG